MSANVLDIADIGELSITSSESINFSCYKMSEMVEWFLDSGCTNHITPRKSSFVRYKELGQLHKAEIADGKYLCIEGFGTVIGHSKMPQGLESLQIRNVLYIPEANKWLFSLMAVGQHRSMSQQQKRVQPYPRMAHQSQENYIPLTWCLQKTEVRYQE